MNKQQTIYVGTNGEYLAGTYDPTKVETKIRKIPLKFNLFNPETWKGYKYEEYYVNNTDYSNARVVTGTAELSNK